MRLRHREQQLAERVQTIAGEREALEARRRDFETVVAEAVSKRLIRERATLVETAALNAKDAVAAELQEKDLRIAALQKANAGQNERLAAAQAVQLEVERERATLEEAKAEFSLLLQREVNRRMQEVRESAQAKAEERFVVELQERDLQIERLRSDIEGLRKRAEQGSQQLQGSALEVTVEQALRAAFPTDTITPAKKGEAGGDVLQHVVTMDGKVCDPILVESKRTKSWNSEWLEKLRYDQREAHAVHAVLVTQAVPKGITTFGFLDGVWVVTRQFLVSVVTMLRHGIIDVSAVRIASEGRQSKADLVYEYLMRGDFARRVNAVADAIHGLRADYQVRRKRAQRELAVEEQRINSAESALMHLVGDFQGIAGEQLAIEEEIQPALPAGKDVIEDVSFERSA